MRIVAGRWGGRRLAAPRGRRTRPTSDRVREALFSMVEARLGMDFQDARVLDAFAGTGALGLEALSRGALSATLVESDPRAWMVLRSNLGSLDAGDARPVRGDVFRLAEAGTIEGGPFSLLLLDPPYRIEPTQVRGLLETLEENGSIIPGALVVYEHAPGKVADWPDVCESVSERDYGDTVVSVAVYARGD